MPWRLRLWPGDALREARAWGWPFAAGASGLVAAAIVATAVVPQVRRESEAAREAADAAIRRASRATASGSDGRAADAAPARFLAAFPPADARQTRVAALLALALRHSLELRRSEFQLARDKDLGLLRYSVTLPLTGSYAQLRGFVEDALAGDAALSLDRLRLRRASASAATVEADMTWSFYMQGGPDAAASAPR